MAVIHATAKDFDNIISQNKNVLVDFWATWCGPCKMVGPIIEQLASDYEGKVAVVKVNVDEEPDLAAKFGIQSIPTIFLFQDGKQVASDVGARPADFYKDMLDSHL